MPIALEDSLLSLPLRINHRNEFSGLSLGFGLQFEINMTLSKACRPIGSQMPTMQIKGNDGNISQCCLIIALNNSSKVHDKLSITK